MCSIHKKKVRTQKMNLNYISLLSLSEKKKQRVHEQIGRQLESAVAEKEDANRVRIISLAQIQIVQNGAVNTVNSQKFIQTNTKA